MTTVPKINDISHLRQRAQDQLDRLAYIEAATVLIPLGERLRRHQTLLDRHDLFVGFENDPTSRHPGLFLVRRDHSACARIWLCYNSLRLDAHGRSPSSEVYTSPTQLFARDLSIDLDVTEQAILTILERDQLVLGNAYMPARLTIDLAAAQRELPNFTAPTALPPPTIELAAVEVKPTTPSALRPVALARKPTRRS